jgi:hypothetical protein
MKLYWIKPDCYGTHGAMIVSETESGAIALYRKAFPEHDSYTVTAELVCDDLTKESVGPRIDW